MQVIVLQILAIGCVCVSLPFLLAHAIRHNEDCITFLYESGLCLNLLQGVTFPSVLKK